MTVDVREPPHVEEEDRPRLFQGSGNMRALHAGLDWAATPLGPPTAWPQPLRTAVRLMLASPMAMSLWCGAQYTLLYNDAYQRILGCKHPAALGRSGAKVWDELWPALGAQFEQVRAGGSAVYVDEAQFMVDRVDGGGSDECWFTYSLTALTDETGACVAVHTVVVEATERVRGHSAFIAERARAESILQSMADAHFTMDADFRTVSMNQAMERWLGAPAAMRAESALRESETRFRAVQDASPNGFALHRPMRGGGRQDGAIVDFKITYVNAAGAQIVGSTPERMLGHTLLELWPRTKDEGVFAAYVRVLETGEPHHMELLYQHTEFDGGLALTVVRVGDELAITFTDVTERLRAERERARLLKELTVERARLAYVFQHAPAFLAVVRGPDHVFELVNDSYQRLVGDRTLVGKPVREALPELRAQGFLDLIDGVLTSGVPYVGREVSVLLSRTPGEPLEERFADFVYLPLVEADGSRSGVIAHGTDVTEQVLARREIERLYGAEQQARAAVEEAYGAADAANRAKAEFLATMSHELRTPLNAIGGYAELIAMGIRGPVTPEQQDDLRRIMVSKRHLSDLINDVLDYAKLETGTVSYDITDVPVREELTTADLLVTPQARAKGLTLAFADCPPVTACADTAKLRQILINLLSNAVKFTDQGGRIEISCAAEHGFVMVRVRDTGIGISADKLEAIFDAFVQVHAGLTRTQEGTGLGLAISRNLARGMGGDLTAESTPGVGSTFTLTLPAA